MIAALAAAATAAAATGVPTGDASAAANADVLVPSPVPAVTQAIMDQPVAGAEGLKNVVAARSDTIGGIVNTLDSLAIQVGSTRVSLWDMTVVVLVVVIMSSIAWTASKLAHRLLANATRLDLTQRLLAEKMTSLVVWAIAILVGIDILGIDLTAFTVFSGAFGLAIGFGLQKTFGNLISGMILLADRSIKPGDMIAVGDGANRTAGRVGSIGIRAVSVVTRDRVEYLIPNEHLMTTTVENWSFTDRHKRVKIPVHVAYGTDLVLARQLMIDETRKLPQTSDQHPAEVWLLAFGESAIQFEIQLWIGDPQDNVGGLRSDLLMGIFRAFDEHGISIPNPQRDIHVKAWPGLPPRTEGDS